MLSISSLAELWWQLHKFDARPSKHYGSISNSELRPSKWILSQICKQLEGANRIPFVWKCGPSAKTLFVPTPSGSRWMIVRPPFDMLFPPRCRDISIVIVCVTLYYYSNISRRCVIHINRSIKLLVWLLMLLLLACCVYCAEVSRHPLEHARGAEAGCGSERVTEVSRGPSDNIIWYSIAWYSIIWHFTT